MRKRTLFALLLAAFVLVGCTSGDVSLVKDGTMNGYESTTIGKAFDASFDSPKWEAFETDKGQRVVEFTGKISKTMHDNWISLYMSEYDALIQQGNMLAARINYLDVGRVIAGSEKFDQLIKHYADQGYDSPERAALNDAIDGWHVWQTGTPAKFQWVINADGKSFQLTHWESSAWKMPAGSINLSMILDHIYR